MIGHTPGPWATDRKAALRVLAADDVTICSTGCADSERYRWEANARLIAAAPEMLAVLKLLVEGYYDEDGINLKSVVKDALQAIAKATGAQP